VTAGRGPRAGDRRLDAVPRIGGASDEHGEDPAEARAEEVVTLVRIEEDPAVGE
jgi:hypothetical protein